MGFLRSLVAFWLGGAGGAAGGDQEGFPVLRSKVERYNGYFGNTSVYIGMDSQAEVYLGFNASSSHYNGINAQMERYE